MFTGIITDVGRVVSIDGDGDHRVRIATELDTSAIGHGASISCDGACLTVVDKGPDWFAVDVSGETLSKTTLGEWGPGIRVNLERALCLGEELGGHLMTGHVDGVGEVVARRPEGDSVRFDFRAPVDLTPMIAVKGSIAVDGISLTVNDITGERFGVNIIPFTQSHTTLGARAVGDRVNLEVDLLARYVARLMHARAEEQRA